MVFKYIRIWYTQNMSGENYEKIERIIRAGIRAPSGDNVQPWRFVVSGNSINIFDIPERDTSLYNCSQNTSHIAHGAAIENMVIAAGVFGYNIIVKYFPEQTDQSLVATLILSPSKKVYDSLYEAIIKRCTNRKAYRQQKLDVKLCQAILSCNTDHPSSKIILFEDPQQIKKLASAQSANEQIVLENQRLHSFLFHHIRWSEKEEKTKKDGMYIKTLELPPPQKAIFRLYSYWPIAKFFNFIGLSKVVAKENARIFASSAALGAIAMKSDSPLDYVEAGRVFQRIWLTVTAHNAWLQPLTGITFFIRHIQTGHPEHFSEKHQKIIRNSYEILKKSCRIDKGTIALFFRIGYGPSPSANSSRQKPIISYLC